MMKDKNKNAGNGLKFSVYSTIMIAMTLIAVLLVNYIITQISNNYDLSADMTSKRIYSLSGTTKQVISELKTDVFIYTTWTSDSVDQNADELINKYAASSDLVHTINIDIVKNPAAVDYYNSLSADEILSGSIIVSDSADTRSTEQRYKVIGYDELYIYNEESAVYDEFAGESALTNAIKSIVNQTGQRIWLLDDHSPGSSANLQIINMLEEENYKAEMLSIINGENPLQNGDIVIITDVQGDLTSTERDVLKQFLDIGGRIIIALDTTDTVKNNMENLMYFINKYNIYIQEGIIRETDPANIAVTNQNEYIYSYIIPEMQEHEITNRLAEGGYKTLLGKNAGALALPEKINNSNIKIEPILKTSATSYIESQNGEIEHGGFTVMAAVTEKINEEESAKLIVLTSPDMFSGEEIFSQSVFRNTELLLSCILWLEDSKEQINISGKPLSQSPLMIETIKQAYTIIFIVCAVIPVLIFGAGIAIYARRKNL
ncbi:MAG: Gldg family protein [Clostridia bacterium]|nr:Gldg family protein [Clostridia bacterium]